MNAIARLSHVPAAVVLAVVLGQFLLPISKLTEARSISLDTSEAARERSSNTLDSSASSATAASSFTPGFTGKCFSDSSESSSAGHRPFFVQEHFTCVTPGVVQPYKALVADAKGNVDIQAATASGLLTLTAGLTDGVATLNEGSLDGLLKIVPGTYHH
jgi:hypothetical protein